MSVRDDILTRARRPLADVGPPDVEGIAACVRGTSLTMPLSEDDFRILAYGLYHGAIDAADILPYADGMAAALRATLQALTPLDDDEAEGKARAFADFAPLRGLAIHDDTGRSAWALAGLDLVALAAPRLLLDVVGTPDDPGRFVDAYLFSGYLPSDVKVRMPAKMLASTSRVSVLCAAEWLWDAMKQWITWRDSARPPEVSILTSSSVQDNALIAFAVVLDRFVSFSSRGYGDNETLRKTQEAAQLLSDIGAELLKTPRDVKRVVRQAGRRSLEVLAMLARFAELSDMQENAKGEIIRTGFEAFKTTFAPNLDRRTNDDGELVFVSMIEPLARVVKNNLAADFFADTMDGLLAGRFEMLTNYRAWLKDRPRSIALVLVGALAAEHAPEDGTTLKDAVIRAAQWVNAQPGNEFAFSKFDTSAAAAFLGTSVPSC